MKPFLVVFGKIEDCVKCSPYSSELVLYTFFLFPKLKIHPKSMIWWFGFIYLFNSILTTSRLFNTENWFISKCLTIIITLFSMFLCYFFLLYLFFIHKHLFWQLYDIKYYLIQKIYTQLYGFKYSYLILIIYIQLDGLKQ